MKAPIGLLWKKSGMWWKVSHQYSDKAIKASLMWLKWSMSHLYWSCWCLQTAWPARHNTSDKPCSSCQFHSGQRHIAHHSPQRFAGLFREEKPFVAAVVAGNYSTLTTVVPPRQSQSWGVQRTARCLPVDESELNFLAVHAGVGLAVRDPNCRVTVSRLLARLPYEFFNALRGENWKLTNGVNGRTAPC